MPATAAAAIIHVLDALSIRREASNQRGRGFAERATMSDRIAESASHHPNAGGPARANLEPNLSDLQAKRAKPGQRSMRCKDATGAA